MFPDSHDIKILEILQADGRASVSDISRQIHLSPTPVAQRLKKLEDKGFISGYRAVIDPVTAGLDLLVFVQVTLKTSDEKSLQAFNRAIQLVPNIVECHMVGGDFDYLVKMRVASMADYRNLLAGEIGSLPMVQGTHSYFVMEEVRDNGAIPVKSLRQSAK